MVASGKLGVTVTWSFLGRQEKDLRLAQKLSLVVYSVEQPAQIEEKAEAQPLARCSIVKQSVLISPRTEDQMETPGDPSGQAATGRFICVYPSSISVAG